MTGRRTLRRFFAAASAAVGCLCAGAAFGDEGLAAAQAWAGKYFTDDVDGRTFYEVPAIRAAVAAVLPPQEMQWLEDQLVVTAPVAVGKGLVVVWSCEPHNCGPHNWTTVLDLDTGEAYACIHVEGDTATKTAWRSSAHPVPVSVPSPAGCASELAPALAALRAARF